MQNKRPNIAFLKGITFGIALSLTSPALLCAGPSPTLPSMPTMQSAYGQLPLSFEANKGQTAPQVQFLSRGPAHELFLTSTEAVLALRSDETKGAGQENVATHGKPSGNPPSSLQSVVRMTFEGANADAKIGGLQKLPGLVNYFLGNDPSKWRTNIPTYEKVEYKNIYTGIDVVYYGNQGRLEYDLIVAPGADPNVIRVVFDGAKRVKIDPETGDLVLTLSASSTNPELRSGSAELAPTLRLQKPVAYQKDEHGDKHLLDGRYVLVPSEASPLTPPVAFQVAAYDASKPLIIDPVLSWATYLGGSGTDNSQRIALDSAGNAYVTGYTNTSGSGFTGTAGSSFQSISGGTWDAYVTKINAAGTALVYSTYLGGSGQDLGHSIAVDAAGQAYVTGYTDTVGFPGTASSSIQSTYGGGLAGC